LNGVVQINDPDPYIWIVSRSFCHILELYVLDYFIVGLSSLVYRTPTIFEAVISHQIKDLT